MNYDIINFSINNDKYKILIFLCGMNIAYFSRVLSVTFMLSIDSTERFECLLLFQGK